AAELDGAPRERDHELGIDEGLAPREAEDPDPRRVRALEEADRGVDLEPVLPLDRHAAVGAREVAGVGPAEREVIRAEDVLLSAPPRGPSLDLRTAHVSIVSYDATHAARDPAARRDLR